MLRATADVLIRVEKSGANGDLVGFQVISGRDIEPMEAPISLRLVRHETEWEDKDGSPLVSCIVQTSDEPATFAGSRQKGLGPAQTQVLQAAQKLAARRHRARTMRSSWGVATLLDAPPRQTVR